MIATQVLVVPVPQLWAWRPEVVLAVTALLGLVAAAWPRSRPRLIVLAGLAVATGLAATTLPTAAIAPLGPHFVVDPAAALVRLVIIVMTLMVHLVLHPRDETVPGALVLACLGSVWLAEATTLGGLLVATATVIVGAGATARGLVAPVDRPAVAAWVGTAGLGFGVLAFAGTLWCGVTGTLDLVAGPAALALRPSLPSTVLPLLLTLVGAGLALALLGEPGRFHRGEVGILAPVFTGWLTAVPLLALVTMLDRILGEISAAPPLAAVPVLSLGLAAVLIAGGFLAALAQPRLERRLAWAAVGQAGLALLGFAALPQGQGQPTPILMLLAMAPAQLGAMMLAGVLVPLREDSRWRTSQLVLLTGFLISLAALPPMAGWRPRVELLADLLAADRYPALILAAVGTLLGCLVYLRPLAELWRTDTGDADTGTGWAAPATVLAAVLLALLLGWGLGLSTPVIGGP